MKSKKPHLQKMEKNELQEWVKNVRLAQELVEAVQQAFDVGIDFKNAADEPLETPEAVLFTFRDEGRVFVRKPEGEFDEWVLQDFKNPKE